MHLVVQFLVGYKFISGYIDLTWSSPRESIEQCPTPQKLSPYFTCDHHKHLGSEAQSLFSYRRLSWNERMQLFGLLTTLCHPYTNKPFKIQAAKKKVCTNNNHNRASFTVNSTSITAITNKGH
uniref:Uncharacterized protein n=1 Tax=Oryza barthii TaxID=65489 RepID=A0A0D3HE57_9ORYZ